MDEIVVRSPFDAHCHFREGDLLRQVVPLTAAQYSAAIVMPNLERPIDTWERMVSYRGYIREAAGDLAEETFRPYMTAYFRTTFTRLELENLVRHGMLAVKFYPKNLTTNSQHGCDLRDPEVDDVLAVLEEMGIPLCVHPEAPGYHEDREYLFAPTVHRWATKFPNLKIILEHLSDTTSRWLLEYPKVYATVTPHHMLLTGDDWVGPPLRPHLYCMPVAKQPKDRDELAWLATSSHWVSKVMLGSDSAPHPVGRKECAEGCAGVFTAPIALALVADVFDQAGRLDQLQAFCSDNAQRIYGIELPAKEVRLVRKPFRVPERYGDIVPLFAGQLIPWSVEL